jgi:predicted metal-binding protein
MECLSGARTSAGPFARYQKEGGAEIVGIISCDGCPTLVAPERLLGRVRSLQAVGAEAIHLSSCMTSLCPYRSKYAKLIREACPGIEVVEGTHEHPLVTPEMFQQMVKGMLTQRKATMANAIEDLAKMAPPTA